MSEDVSKIEDGKLSFGGCFLSSDLETEYLQQQFHDDKIRVRAAIGISMIGFLAFIVSDIHFVGVTSTFWKLLTLRVSLFLFSVWILAGIDQTKSFLIMARLVLIWVVLNAGAIVYIYSTRPTTYTAMGIMMVLCLLGNYCVMPLKLRPQLIFGVFTSLAVLVLAIWVKPMSDSAALFVLFASLFTANFLGAIVSAQLNRWKRRQFFALKQQIELRVNLEKALSEIKTLRGFIPICAHCKKIRDDAGYWQQVEIYIRDRTSAEFTHGICPDCVPRFFPGKRTPNTSKN